MKRMILFIFVFFLLSSSVYAVSLSAANYQYFSFDGADLVGHDDPDDLTTNNNDGTGYGSPSVNITGKLLECFNYTSATNDYVNTGISPRSNDMAVNIWFKAPQKSSLRYVMGTYDGGGASSIRIWIDTNGKLNTLYREEGGTYHQYTSTARVDNETWFMTTVSSDDTNMYTYINGKLVNKGALTGHINLDYDILIGAFNDHGSTINHFDGLIDEWSIWERNLSVLNITTIYNGGTGYNWYKSGPPTGNYFSITAKDNSTGSKIYNFSANVSGSIFYSNVSTGVLMTDILQNLSLIKNITVFSVNYNPSTYLNYNTSTNLIAYLSRINILDIYIYNASDLSVANTTNITVYIENETGFYKQNITYSGYLAFFDLAKGNYTVTFSGQGYQDGVYVVYMNGYSSNFLNAYLEATSADDVVFTIIDRDSTAKIPNAVMTIKKKIQGNYYTVNTKISDISGRIQFSYDDSAAYRFVTQKANYFTKTFDLNPIIFDSYDVPLIYKLGNFSTGDYGNIYLSYSPKEFYADQNNSFTFAIYSPEGFLLDYGFSLDYPSNNISRSGTVSSGEIFNVNFTIPALSKEDVLNLSFYYNSTSSGYRQFSFNYPIIVVGNYTIIDVENRRYGLGQFETVLAVTLSVIFVGGLGTLAGGGFVGLLLIMLVMSYFTYTHIVPIWLFLISMFIGFMILAWRSGL